MCQKCYCELLFMQVLAAKNIIKQLLFHAVINTRHCNALGNLDLSVETFDILYFKSMTRAEYVSQIVFLVQCTYETQQYIIQMVQTNSSPQE
jgi:hypothetical protein